MSSRATLNLVLAAVVVALVWLALEGGDAPGPEAGLAVTNLDPAGVVRIRVEAVGRRPVRLRRDGEIWRITEPFEAAADPFRVRALLGLAAAKSGKGFRAAGNDLSQYGLQPPRATVVFDDEALQFGITDPVENLRYVKSDDQVHLLPDRWFSQVFGDAAAWLDPRPLGGAEDIVAIALPDARWDHTDRGWQRTPAIAGLSADSGPRLADAWRHARALSVQAMDPGVSWSGEVRIALGSRHEPVVFTVASVPDAVLLGNPALQVQYRFLPRQGDALLGRGAKDE